MRVKKFYLRLSSEDAVLARLKKDKNMLKDVLIVYFARINDEVRQIFRVDCAHGFLHRDLLFLRPPKKELIEAPLSGKLVSGILEELKLNWKEYRKKFIRNYFEGRAYGSQEKRN